MDRTDKMAVYARERVGHLWFVNPVPRTIEVYRFEPGGWCLVNAFKRDAKVRAEPFDAVVLDLATLWAR